MVSIYGGKVFLQGRWEAAGLQSQCEYTGIDSCSVFQAILCKYHLYIYISRRDPHRTQHTSQVNFNSMYYLV